VKPRAVEVIEDDEREINKTPGVIDVGLSSLSSKNASSVKNYERKFNNSCSEMNINVGLSGQTRSEAKAERTLRLIETNLVGVDEFLLNWLQYAPHHLKLVDL